MGQAGWWAGGRTHHFARNRQQALWGGKLGGRELGLSAFNADSFVSLLCVCIPDDERQQTGCCNLAIYIYTLASLYRFWPTILRSNDH